MDLQKLVSDVHEILAANGDYSNLSDKDIYVNSIQVDVRNVYFDLHQTVNKQTVKSLVVYEDRDDVKDFDARESIADADKTLIVGDLNEQNWHALTKRFNWLKPTSRHGHKYTFGLGDRLGLASNAHLRLFKGRGIMPVLAQQSIRELLLTNRTETDVLLDAGWAVFDEGFTTGWADDGDHVKNPHEVDYAIKAGCTMITLDSTEKIHNEIADLTDEQLDAKYNALDDDLVKYFNDTYLDKTFQINDQASVHFSKKDVEQSVLIFNGAVQYAIFIYHKFIKPYNLDFEISMDEAIVPTTPANHYFFANELHEAGITPETIAPRFYGEFQKAIDYIGDVKRFEREFVIHEAIAEHFGYKLSIHSGSDKLSVYEIIGRLSNKHGWHVKTAGTNWLEALRVIAHADPKLMQEIYKFSYENLDDVAAFYVFNAQTDGKAPKPETINDSNVMTLLQDDDARQVLHTMYGSILNYQKSYRYVFRDKFFKILKENQAQYDKYLIAHIAQHIDLLQGKAKTKAEVQAKYEPKD
ncbi:tagaturonate epimerase family protein [Levilactobacillus zymae]|uniref:tagaturonate epimerase family protein n=1 Tax=Levilactobacillus zymae TaxID=267363 RepID=UPI0028B791DA|nr:tagaturonate epimerase family protein [Levilactobacillus zymae]MDT6981569.1 tagaturonate epimerase family protein [Levilactobacillus zymae]